MLNNDLGNITSTDTLRECNESPTMETYNFWNHHKSLAQKQINLILI